MAEGIDRTAAGLAGAEGSAGERTDARGKGRGPALRLRGVRKAFEDVQAVDGLDLTVERGRVLRAAGAEWGGEDNHH